MKRIVLVLAGLLALVGHTYSGAHYPDVCLVSGETGSVLCAGLVEHFTLLEASDSPRFGAGMSYLQEAPGQNVAYDAVDGGADFDGTTSKWLWANVIAPSDSFTITFRIKVKSLGSSGQKKSILSWHNTNFKGPDIYWENNAGQGRFCIGVYEAETTNPAKTACVNATAGTQYFVAVGSSHFHDGKANVFISLNGGARTTTATAYWQHGGLGYMRVGGRPINGPADASDQALDAVMTTLDFYSRPVSDYEITLLYNGGGSLAGGRTFPYDTN